MPTFLETLPIDPLTSQPLRYVRREDGNYDPYSAGMNGVDDGGNTEREAGRYSPMDIVFTRPRRDTHCEPILVPIEP